GSFLLVGPMSFITRGTRACNLLRVRTDQCGDSGTKRNKAGGGVTRKPAHRFGSHIPARRSSSSQFQVNDLTKRNHENKIRIHHYNYRVAAAGRICANTACSATATATAGSPGNAGSSRERAQGSSDIPWRGDIAGATGRE